MRCARTAIALGLLAIASSASARAAALALRHQAIALDGLPISILSADLDRDGRRDLAVVTSGARWGELGFSETIAIDDSGAFADALTVVPALFERREIVVHRGAAGGFVPAALRFELPVEVRSIDAAGRALPLAVWTDGGLSEITIGVDGALALVERTKAPSLLAGSIVLLPPMGLVVDLDGDRNEELLVPTERGLAIVRVTGGVPEPEPFATLAVPLEERLPGDASRYAEGPVRRTPLPVARDLDGDGLPELLFRNHDRGWNQLRVLRNLGALRFSAPLDPTGGRARDAEPSIVHVGDLDGKPGAEILTVEEIENKDESMRAEMREAKRPRQRYRIHALGPDLVMHAEPLRTFEMEGHLAGGESLGRLSPMRDLDGDGRVDLVPVRFDFSLFEAARAMAAKRIQVGIELGVHCQGADGTFRESAKLTGELKLKLDALRVGQTNSLTGDYDGDGRADYLRLGPGAKAELFLGKAGCRYAAKPDATIALAAEPLSAELVHVDDYDGDGRSDLAIVRPRRGAGEADVASTLDLYLSGAER